MDRFDLIARQAIDGLLEPLGLDPRRDRTKAYELLAVKLRAGFVDLYAELQRHNSRVTELLAANNDEVERRREAEAKAAALEAGAANTSDTFNPYGSGPAPIGPKEDAA